MKGKSVSELGTSVANLLTGARDPRRLELPKPPEAIKRLVEYSLAWGIQMPRSDFLELLEAKYDLALAKAAARVVSYEKDFQDMQKTAGTSSFMQWMAQIGQQQAMEESYVMFQAKNEVKTASAIVAMIVEHLR